MKKNKGFSLIELLVVIAITAILISLSVIGLQGARESSRDAKRKADLELLRSGFEMYRADCGVYPPSMPSGQLVGSGTPTACSASNVYISSVPTDPLGTNYYYLLNGSNYQICATLEQTPTTTCSTTCCSNGTYNYSVTNP